MPAPLVLDSGSLPLVVLVGFPHALRARIQPAFRGRLRFEYLYLAHRAPRIALEYPDSAADILDLYVTDHLAHNRRVHIFVFQYSRIPESVLHMCATLQALGATVTEIGPTTLGWPSRPPRLDDQFLSAFFTALRVTLSEMLGEPETLADAVRWARQLFAEELYFGSDVERGIATVDARAGPPPKVMRHLQILASATAARRAHQMVGGDVLTWLTAQNVPASGETPSTRDSPDAMRKRTWNAGPEDWQFTLHMKPNRNTAPDLCVRIYFKWCEKRRLYVIGWVGCHPE